MSFYLYTIDWVAIGAIASFVMVIVTFVTLRQNKKQIDELKRQWDEQNRPDITFKIIQSDYFICLQILNVGNAKAYDIFFEFNKEFIDLLKVEGTSLSMTDSAIETFPLDLVKGQAKSYPLFIRIEGMPDSILKTMINIRGGYNGKYEISQKFKIEDFIFEEKDSINVLNDTVKSLTKEVASINTAINSINNNNTLKDISRALDRGLNIRR